MKSELTVLFNQPADIHLIIPLLVKTLLCTHENIPLQDQ